MQARQVIGRELNLVQQGREPHDWKVLTAVGHGAMELRIHTDLEHRLIYVSKYPEAVYVLHAFEKRSAKIARRDMQLVRARLSWLIDWRQNLPRKGAG